MVLVPTHRTCLTFPSTPPASQPPTTHPLTHPPNTTHPPHPPPYPFSKKTQADLFPFTSSPSSSSPTTNGTSSALAKAAPEAQDALLHALLQHLVLPRALMSPEDAMFSPRCVRLYVGCVSYVTLCHVVLIFFHKTITPTSFLHLPPSLSYHSPPSPPHPQNHHR